MIVIILAIITWVHNTKDNQSDQKSVSAEISITEKPNITPTPGITKATETTKNPAATQAPKATEPAKNNKDAEDPQNSNMGSDTGAIVDVRKLLSSGNVNENNKETIGIDVAKYQGTIDWKKVAASGIDFAMVRVGYRTQKTGIIYEDTNAKYNMQQAQANGIKIGVYFFSTAVTQAEAKEEADWVANIISKYKITYPVAYDCEGFDQADSRQYTLTNTERTDIAIAFMQEIHKKGYTPMFYAAMNELQGNKKWDTERIEKNYKIWVAQYPGTPYPETKDSSYDRIHDMWQYTNQGTITGINKPVDVNVAYFGYEGTAEAMNQDKPDAVEADKEALMNFKEVNEKEVTAKETANLRDVPSQGTDSKVLATLKNGEIAMITGESASGWSRLSYNGKTYYAVSSLLTTDLSYVTPAKATPVPTDGLKTKFTQCNERVTAKEEVNLRNMPSLTDPNSEIDEKLMKDEIAIRTGINLDVGWSRVEYKGQILYCISSYLSAVN